MNVKNLGTAGRLVRPNAALDAPAAVAVTLNAPAVAFAVRIGDVAMPSDPVFTVAAPPNVALGPLAGAAKVTATDGTTFPNSSVTLAFNVSANGARTGVVWPLPATTATERGAAGVIVKDVLPTGGAVPVAACSV